MAIKKHKYEVIEEYNTTITYTCPERGEVTETVKVKKYGSPPVPEEQRF